MQSVFTYSTLLLTGYCISTIAFLVAAIFQQQLKRVWSDYLDVANLFVLVFTFLVTTISVISYYNNYTGGRRNDLQHPNHLSHFLTTVVLIGVVPLVYLSKRLRRKVLVTIGVVACVTWVLFNEVVYIWITHYYRDYVPSSWSFSHAESPLPYVVAATVIYFAVAFTVAIRKGQHSLTRRKKL